MRISFAVVVLLYLNVQIYFYNIKNIYFSNRYTNANATGAGLDRLSGRSKQSAHIAQIPTSIARAGAAMATENWTQISAGIQGANGTKARTTSQTGGGYTQSAAVN